MITTTLRRIRDHAPCESGWRKLLASLGKTTPDDEPLPLVRILESNGLDDALWALRAVEGHDREIRLFAVACVRRVAHLNPDPRVAKALDTAERYANGQATAEELAEARVAALAAALAAARAPKAAKYAALEASAAETAWLSAIGAARYAARAAADAALANEREVRRSLFVEYFGGAK